jgi:hypothetical protein
MNSSSFLLYIVFAAIGYVAHPMLLPKLVDSNFVAESSLSDSSKEKKVSKTEKDLPRPEVDDEEDIAIIPIKPEVVEQPAPTIPIPEVVINPVQDTAEDSSVTKLSEQDFINVLKNSVKAGDVNEFEFDQVLEWKLEGTDGSYQIGMITYVADTIFDEQQLEAKALVEDGKVVKWLWPTTNTEMR